MCADNLFHVASTFFISPAVASKNINTHCTCHFYMNTVGATKQNSVHMHTYTVLDKEGERRREADTETARLIILNNSHL